MFTYRIDDDLLLRLPEESDAEAMLALFKRDREYLTYWNDWPIMDMVVYSLLAEEWRARQRQQIDGSELEIKKLG